MRIVYDVENANNPSTPFMENEVEEPIKIVYQNRVRQWLEDTREYNFDSGLRPLNISEILNSMPLIDMNGAEDCKYSEFQSPFGCFQCLKLICRK